MGFLAAAIHWFNPFSWIFLKTFLSDLELACDETALSAVGFAILILAILYTLLTNAG